MLRVLADYPDNTLALNNLALLAHRLYGCSNLHCLLILLPIIFGSEASQSPVLFCTFSFEK